MKIQSRLGVTIPTDCSCNCWGSIRQETPGDVVHLFHEGCDDFEWEWCKYDGDEDFPVIPGTANDNTYTPTDPSELIFVVFRKSNCCDKITNTIWVNT